MNFLHHVIASPSPSLTVISYQGDPYIALQPKANHFHTVAKKTLAREAVKNPSFGV